MKVYNSHKNWLKCGKRTFCLSLFVLTDDAGAKNLQGDYAARDFATYASHFCAHMLYCRLVRNSSV
jgi:hypothetical protein